MGVMCGDDTVLVAVWNEFIHYLGLACGRGEAYRACLCLLRTVRERVNSVSDA